MYNKITMALECCIKQAMNCKDCPYEKHRHRDCTDRFYADVINFFNRQKAEIERKGKILNSYALQYGTVTDQSKKIKEIKDEAYEEFADLFKKEMRNCANAEFDEIKYYLIGEEFVNRLAKELTEKGR